jgi:chemotaxis protein CheZ
MAEPRKIFRIEANGVPQPGQKSEAAPAGREHAEIMRELTALRALLTAAPSLSELTAPQRTDTTRPVSERNIIHGTICGNGRGHGDGSAARPQAASMTRVAHELNAVVQGTEHATQKILAAAENIDQVAADLSAALNGRIEQGFAQDIQDLVIHIFEACNFQDLIGQRVTKVMATLTFIEDHIERVRDEIKNAPMAAGRRNGLQSLHGPRLDNEGGHASQIDIDAMFGTEF